MTHRVLICEPSEIVANGLSEIINGMNGFAVVSRIVQAIEIVALLAMCITMSYRNNFKTLKCPDNLIQKGKQPHPHPKHLWQSLFPKPIKQTSCKS